MSAAPQFDTVYREHAPFVWRVLRSMGVPTASVPDAVQDVFVVVHRRLPEFDYSYRITTWLFRIAYRIACEHRRKQARTHGQEVLHEGMQDGGRSPQEELERSRATQLLFEILEQMDDEKRVVLVLADIEEMSAPEIALMTDAPINTVYTRLRRARLEFSAILEAMGKRK